MLVLVFSVVTPSELVSRYQRLGGAAEEHIASILSPEDGGSMFLRNASIYP
jgi:hypothetical protein